jgi:hypothetical protein
MIEGSGSGSRDVHGQILSQNWSRNTAVFPLDALVALYAVFFFVCFLFTFSNYIGNFCFYIVVHSYAYYFFLSADDD